MFTTTLPYESDTWFPYDHGDDKLVFLDDNGQSHHPSSSYLDVSLFDNQPHLEKEFVTDSTPLDGSINSDITNIYDSYISGNSPSYTHEFVSCTPTNSPTNSPIPVSFTLQSMDGVNEPISASGGCDTSSNTPTPIPNASTSSSSKNNSNKSSSNKQTINRKRQRESKESDEDEGKNVKRRKVVKRDPELENILFNPTESNYRIKFPEEFIRATSSVEFENYCQALKHLNINISDDDRKELRRLKRLIKNRESARTSRQKKKQEFNKLNKKIDDLSAVVEELRSENERLRAIINNYLPLHFKHECIEGAV